MASWLNSFYGTATTTSSFREELFHGDPGTSVDDPWDQELWCEWPSRRLRYQVYWSMYLNDLYRAFNKVAHQYKAIYGLDRNIRGIYNPASRLVKFHATHVMGGYLDPDAGTGMERPTSLPLINVDDDIRAAIAKLWSDSRWAIIKSRWVRYGSCFGDGPLRIRDDSERGKVTLQIIHPAPIAEIQRDPQDNVIAYRLCERRLDPRDKNARFSRYGSRIGSLVEYGEECEFDQASGVAYFRTLLNGDPYPWNGVASEWSANYKACPLWIVKHGDTNLPWGIAELETPRTKIDDICDLGTQLHDHLRRQVKGAWYIAGGTDPKSQELRMTATPRSDDRRRQQSQDMKVIWDNNPQAKPWSLINNMNIAQVSAEIRQTLDALEDDHPELKFERLRQSGDISGEAMRTARQPATAAIEAMRTVYDSTQLEAIRVALWIGSMQGYPGYDSLNLSGPDDERLMRIRIGDRPVFSVDTMDRLAESEKRNTVVLLGKEGGQSRQFAMKNAGFTEQEIAENERLLKEEEAQEIEKQKKMAEIGAVAKAKAGIPARDVASRALPRGSSPRASRVGENR